MQPQVSPVWVERVRELARQRAWVQSAQLPEPLVSERLEWELVPVSEEMVPRSEQAQVLRLGELVPEPAWAVVEQLVRQRPELPPEVPVCLESIRH